MTEHYTRSRKGSESDRFVSLGIERYQDEHVIVVLHVALNMHLCRLRCTLPSGVLVVNASDRVRVMVGTGVCDTHRKRRPACRTPAGSGVVFDPGKLSRRRTNNVQEAEGGGASARATPMRCNWIANSR